MNRIFVQIASYRDPELLPTLRDCDAKARHPERLRFGICWQRDQHETLAEFADDPRVRVHAVDWRESQGACWARSLVQQMYAGEDYTLQLDSHHRFVEGWDELLIEMAGQTGVSKPLLTAYAPSFDPADDTKFVREPWSLAFDRFIPEGAVFFKPESMPGWQDMTRPQPGRFVSAHFLFTLGRFCTEVPYDPYYYFHGEEISLSARAFTHGYDIFYPHRVVVWHEYTRRYRTKHWDDHVEGNVEVTWNQRNDATHRRNRILFGMEPGDVDFGQYGFGSERTLQDYERYAGLHFRLRLVHPHTKRNGPPPTPEVFTTDDEWREACVRPYWTRIRIPAGLIDRSADCDFWAVSVHDAEGLLLERQDLDATRVAYLLSQATADGLDFAFQYQAVARGARWTVWPHTRDGRWLPSVTAPLGEVGRLTSPCDI